MRYLLTLFTFLLLLNPAASSVAAELKVRVWIAPMPTQSEQLAFKTQQAPVGVVGGLTINAMALRQIEKLQHSLPLSIQSITFGVNYGNLRFKLNPAVNRDEVKFELKATF